MQLLRPAACCPRSIHDLQSCGPAEVRASHMSVIACMLTCLRDRNGDWNCASVKWWIEMSNGWIDWMSKGFIGFVQFGEVVDRDGRAEMVD